MQNISKYIKYCCNLKPRCQEDHIPVHPIHSSRTWHCQSEHLDGPNSGTPGSSSDRNWSLGCSATSHRPPIQHTMHQKRSKRIQTPLWNYESLCTQSMSSFPVFDNCSQLHSLLYRGVKLGLLHVFRRKALWAGLPAESRCKHHHHHPSNVSSIASDPRWPKQSSSANQTSMTYRPRKLLRYGHEGYCCWFWKACWLDSRLQLGIREA